MKEIFLVTVYLGSDKPSITTKKLLCKDTEKCYVEQREGKSDRRIYKSKMGKPFSLLNNRIPVVSFSAYCLESDINKTKHSLIEKVKKTFLPQFEEAKMAYLNLQNMIERFEFENETFEVGDKVAYEGLFNTFKGVVKSIDGDVVHVEYKDHREIGTFAEYFNPKDPDTPVMWKKVK